MRTSKDKDKVACFTSTFQSPQLHKHAKEDDSYKFGLKLSDNVTLDSPQPILLSKGSTLLKIDTILSFYQQIRTMKLQLKLYELSSIAHQC